MNTLPGVSPLVLDYLDRYSEVRAFFNGDFRDPDSFRIQAEKTRSRRLPRESTAEILREQNRAYGCGPRTLANIDALAGKDACAVVTGQQVGLFSGPLYTIYKSLTAIKLAEKLNRIGEGTFVPVFWMASDDHDAAEIDHVRVLDLDNRIEEIRCPPGSPDLPAAKMILPPEIADCVRRLGDSTPDSEFKAEILDRLGGHYRPGRSFAEAFGGWMTDLFKAFGLVFIDAAHPGLKELGKSVFLSEIATDSQSTARCLETSEILVRNGYHAQIQQHPGKLNLFYTEDRRRAIQSSNGAFRIKNDPKEYAREELLAIADAHPDHFSPNVLLRPIYQDALLPTVAYVGGPGEIAYYAQMKGVYENFSLSMPVIYPRKSFTLVDPKIDEILSRYGLSIPEIWKGADQRIDAIIKERIPSSLLDALHAAASRLEGDFDPVRKEIAAFEPTLKDTAELALGKIRWNFEMLEKKILQAHKKHDEIVTRRLHLAKNAIFPDNRPQERILNIVPYLIKYGPALIDQLALAADLDNPDHQVVHLNFPSKEK
ncbi:MAG: bacillithiol biosynthesis cysteine-adding enzyme BshC [Candidatus Aminicenantales bacterium]